MVDYDTANARLTALATFMGGLSFIGLILSINIMTGKDRQVTATLLISESVNVLFLLTSIVLFLTSAVTLPSAYFEARVPKDIGLRGERGHLFREAPRDETGHSVGRHGGISRRASRLSQDPGAVAGASSDCESGVGRSRFRPGIRPEPGRAPGSIARPSGPDQAHRNDLGLLAEAGVGRGNGPHGDARAGDCAQRPARRRQGRVDRRDLVRPETGHPGEGSDVGRRASETAIRGRGHSPNKGGGMNAS